MTNTTQHTPTPWTNHGTSINANGLRIGETGGDYYDNCRTGGGADVACR